MFESWSHVLRSLLIIFTLKTSACKPIGSLRVWDLHQQLSVLHTGRLVTNACFLSLHPGVSVWLAAHGASGSRFGWFHNSLCRMYRVSLTRGMNSIRKLTKAKFARCIWGRVSKSFNLKEECLEWKGCWGLGIGWNVQKYIGSCRSVKCWTEKIMII